jgi:hypothetical protein
MQRNRVAGMGTWRFLIAALAVWPLLAAGPADGEPCTVLAVMSYEADFPWTAEIMAGVHAVLDGHCRVEAVYLNTKTDFAGGRERAREAYRLYKRLSPQGVIAADDDAQTLFVVPYLAARWPPRSCSRGQRRARGLRLPAANVSGILERRGRGRDHRPGPPARTLHPHRGLHPERHALGPGLSRPGRAEKDSYRRASPAPTCPRPWTRPWP